MFRTNGADITIGSTVLLSAVPNDKMTVSVLQGQAWIRSAGVQQTATTGQQITVGLTNGPVPGVTDGIQANGSPSSVLPFNLRTTTVADDCAFAKALGLKNPCNIPPPALPPPPVGPQKLNPTATFTPTPGSGQVAVPACVIQNFSANPNPAPLQKPSASLANFPAIACSTISWDVEGVNMVMFNGQGVVGHGSQQVCVKQATNYSLSVNCRDGSTKSASLTLNVN